MTRRGVAAPSSSSTLDVAVTAPEGQRCPLRKYLWKPLNRRAGLAVRHVSLAG